ncbi:MAG: hypothetical protein R3268_04560 [Acidiferrobacterales bacterium]|nr:hypothetical protein [Acidiferrobacterales bacterium]
MNATEHLGAYAEGWSKGDADIILKATAADYTFDDPKFGVVSKNALSNYLGELKQTVASLCGGRVPDPFMELSEVLAQEADGVLTAWCWWVIPGTEIKGSGLIKVDPTGVRSEVITYYTKLSG